MTSSPRPPDTERIVSWNVNGIRAIANKGFDLFLDRADASVVGVQEVRASTADIPEAIAARRGWHSHWVEAEKKGYSGVGLLSRRPLDEVGAQIGGRGRYDAEGRVQLVRIGRLLLVNAYFPNGNGPNRDHSRIPFKLGFTRRLFRVLEPQRKAGDRILVMGDFNTAHRDLDLARPKSNRKNSGFTDAEREVLDEQLRRKWTDTFRRFVPEEGGHYSWWSTRGDVRARNIGWRLDMVWGSPAAMEYVRGAFIWPEVGGSDHCPVGVDVDPAIFV